MEKTPSHSPPLRGIIVVDSNMLEEMGTKLPPTLPAVPRSPLANPRGKTESYLDILPILASQGYRIIIPETVMLEAGEMLTKGNDLHKHFTKSRGDRYPTEPMVRTFLRNIQVGMHPNITIAPADTDGTQNYQNYLRDLKNAINNHSDPGRTREAIHDVQIKHEDAKKDMGENHCFDVIENEVVHLLEANKQTPIFFLSADKKARGALCERYAETYQEGDPPVNVLTSGGILLGLQTDQTIVGNQTTNALNQMGLPGKVSQHWEHIYNAFSKTDQNIPPNAAQNDGYEDSPLEAYNTGTSPFAISARGIVAALAEKQGRAGTGSGTYTAVIPPVSPHDRTVPPPSDSGHSSGGRG